MLGINAHKSRNFERSAQKRLDGKLHFAQKTRRRTSGKDPVSAALCWQIINQEGEPAGCRGKTGTRSGLAENVQIFRVQQHRGAQTAADDVPD